MWSGIQTEDNAKWLQSTVPAKHANQIFGEIKQHDTRVTNQKQPHKGFSSIALRFFRPVPNGQSTMVVAM